MGVTVSNCNITDLESPSPNKKIRLQKRPDFFVNQTDSISSSKDGILGSYKKQGFHLEEKDGILHFLIHNVYLYLYAMKMRKFISIVVLAVYSIVIAHNIIPHHHHSDFVESTHICDHIHHQSQHEHVSIADYSNNQEHKHDSHIHCSFDEETILIKLISLSDFILPSIEIEFVGLEINKQSVSNGYILTQIPEPQCRDVQLRGPPQFS